MMLYRRVGFRILLLSCLAALAAGCVYAQGEAAPAPLGPPFVSVNGQIVDPPSSPPVMTAGEILVPLADFFGFIGGDLTEDPAAKTYTVTRGAQVLQMAVDQEGLRIGDQEYAFTIFPVTIGNVVYVDARDVVESLGGTFSWDPATSTADYVIDVLGLGGEAIRGTLAYVDKRATPPYFLITEKDKQNPTPYLGADKVEYLTDLGDGRTQPGALADLQPGDQVEISLNRDDKVGRVLQVRAQIAGSIEYVGQGLILISTPQGRQHFNLAPDVAVQTADGKPYAINSLQSGQNVTLVVNAEGPTALRITVDIAAAAPAPAPATPQILVVAPQSYVGPVNRGGLVSVRLRGTPGGTATFDIGGAIAGIPLQEIQAGDYQGEYRVQAGDNVVEAAIIGHLTANGQVAPPAQSQQLVTVDTTDPVITTVSPKNDETVTNPSPTVLVTYDDPNGSGLDKTTVSLELDYVDVTAQSTVDNFTASYQARNLAAGFHSFQIKLADKAGNRLTERYRFNVQPAPAANKIVSVQHDARQVLVTDDVVTVNLEATEPGQRAYFVIGANWKQVEMARVGQTNTYRGYYRVEQGNTADAVTVTGYLVDVAGTQYQLAATNALTISTALPNKLSITVPPDKSKTAAEKLAIEGLAPPNTKVRVIVQYQDFLKMKALDRDIVTSDARGRWKTKEMALRLGGWKALLGVKQFQIVAQTLDATDQPVGEAVAIVVDIEGAE